MVILITGATHTGKTVLANKLIRKTGFPCLSIDHLKMGLIRSGNTSLTPEDDGELTAYLFPIVREMIKTAIENRQDLIVEGCYVPFDFRRQFDGSYIGSIRFVCLALSDQYIADHFQDIRAHSRDAEQRTIDPCLTPEFLQKENRFYEEGFKAANESVFVVKDNYEAETEAFLTDF